MDEKYFPEKIEEKWQQRWADESAFAARDDDPRPKFYALEMLPYPSGFLHMGHVRNYSIGDALAWYKRLRGFNVLHPIGWDSFGQPAEQAAIKRGIQPRDWTEENIAHMRGQLQRLGISYDWSREIAAHRPDYYKWDQWFFLKMLERGLAYKKISAVNWCPKENTVLSNEQSSGGICWRCGAAVEKRDLEQWFLRITEYAEQLVNDISEIEAHWEEKVGLNTGALAINPFSGESIPVWVANYVLMDYGTGAVMSVPAHDERDFEFAQKYSLPIRQVIAPISHSQAQVEPVSKAMDQSVEMHQAFIDYGVLINSGQWGGKLSDVAIREMARSEEHTSELQ